MAGEGAFGSLLEGRSGILAFGQVVERLPRVARRVQACPVHQYIRQAIDDHLELEHRLPQAGSAHLGAHLGLFLVEDY